MANVSRPLVGVLVAAVAFFALWIVALKPSSSATGGSPSQGLGTYQSAINRAKGVQAVVNRGSAAAAGTTTPGSAHAAVADHGAMSKPAAKANTPSVPHHTSRAKPAHVATSTTATPAQRLGTVERALDEHKVLAVLFYNPAASDDTAVKQELGSVSTDRGKVVKIAVPLNELSSYTAITSQVPVAYSPTLVIINRAGQASEIIGFTDTFEIAQRIADAL
jgi:hypothetical protein